MNVNIYGHDFIFNKDNKISNIEWFLDSLQNKIWEKSTFETFEKYENHEKHCIDIGAWIGPTTLYLSKKFKSVISIEPDVVAFSVLETNIKNNNCNNVEIINKIFFNSTKKSVSFGVNSHNFDPTFGSSTSQTKLIENHSDDYNMDTINIYDIINKIDPSTISFIKIDVEGAEEYFIDEIIKVGSRFGWVLLVAFHYDWWDNKSLDKIKNCLNDIKKVYINDNEIDKNELPNLISKNIPESITIII
jgi:FkbM family methyltransferase